MTRKFRPSAKMSDPRQIELFGDDDIEQEDPLVAFYRRLRKVGAYLSYDIDENRLLAGHDYDVLSRWVVAGLRLLRTRIVTDLKRVEYGIVEPHDEPEALDGGATLHRLPPPRSPELDPPVRQRTPAHRRGPGAA